MKFFAVLLTVLPAVILAADSIKDGAGSDNPIPVGQSPDAPATTSIPAPSSSAGASSSSSSSSVSNSGNSTSSATVTSATDVSHLIKSMTSAVVSGSGTLGAPINSSASASAVNGTAGNGTAGSGAGLQTNTVSIAGFLAVAGAVSALIL